jgi:hypothetical protein
VHCLCSTNQLDCQCIPTTIACWKLTLPFLIDAAHCDQDYNHKIHMHIFSTDTDITHYAVHIKSGTPERGIHARTVRKTRIFSRGHSTFIVHMTLLSAFQYNVFKLCLYCLSFTNQRFFQIFYQLKLACRKLLCHYSRISVTLWSGVWIL